MPTFSPGSAEDKLKSKTEAVREDLSEMDESLAVMRNSIAYKEYDNVQVGQENSKEKTTETSEDRVEVEQEALKMVEESPSEKKEEDQKNNGEKKMPSRAEIEATRKGLIAPVAQGTVKAQMLEGGSEDVDIKVEDKKRDHIAEYYDEMKKKGGKEKMKTGTAETVNKNESIVPETNDSVENSQEEKEKSSGEMKKEVDVLFETALAAKEKLQSVEKNRGALKKIQSFLGSSDSKEGHINKEFKDAKEAFEKAQTDYREKYTEFANKIIAEKKVEIEKKEGPESKRIASNEKLVEGTEKNLEGQLEKMTIFEHMKQNEDRLIAERIENLDEKQRGLFGKMKDKYSSLPKAAKFGLGFVASTGISAGAGALMGVGVAYYLGYKVLKDKFIKKVAMWAGMGAVVGGAHRLLKQDTALFKEDSKDKAEKNTIESLETEKGDIFKALDKHNRQVKWKGRREKLLIGGLAGVTAITLGSFDLDEIKDVLSGSNNVPGQGGGGLEIVSGDIGETEVSATSEADVADNIEKAGVKLEEVQEIDPEKFKSSFTEGALNEDIEKPWASSIEEVAEQQEQFLNKKFELEKGDCVWDKLDEHFNGDKNKVVESLAEFKEKTVKELVANYDMNETQAKKFIGDRYRDMAIGTEFELKDGKLEIPKFIDDEMIEKIKIDQPVAETSTAGTGIVEDIAIPVEAAPVEANLSAEQTDGINEEVETLEKSAGNLGEAELETSIGEGGQETEAEKAARIDYEAKIDEITKEAVEKDIKDIYEHWWEDRREEWDEVKKKTMEEIYSDKFIKPSENDIDSVRTSSPGATFPGEFGESIGEGINSVETNHRVQLQNRLRDLQRDANIAYNPGEKAGDFLYRAEKALHSRG